MDRPQGYEPCNERSSRSEDTIPVWFNGRMRDSDSRNGGSIPSTGVENKASPWRFFCFLLHIKQRKKIKIYESETLRCKFYQQ